MPTQESDNRISCLGYIEELNQHTSTEYGSYAEEYEYFSDSRICGVFSFGEYRKVTFRMIDTDINEYGYYRYLLRIPTIVNTSSPDYSQRNMNRVNNATEEGYYFMGGMNGEIISIFAVFLRARFFLRSRIFRDNEEVSTKTVYPVFLPVRTTEYSSIFNDDKKNLTSDLIPFFQKIASLPDNGHFDMIHAFKEYHEALKNIGVNQDIAYLKLVIALEGIASIEKDKPNFKDDFPECYELIKEDERCKQVEDLWKNTGSIKSVNSFLAKYLSSRHPRFKETFYMNERGEEKKILLKTTMSRIYKARSKYVHEGKVMIMSRIGTTNSPYEPILGATIDRRKIAIREILPLISYFDELVGLSLMNYVEQNSQ